MSTVLLYHAKGVGPVCKRIAAALPNVLRAESDRTYEPQDGDLVIRWDSVRPVFGDLVELQSPEAVKQSRNKAASRRVMGDIAPRTWFRIEDVEFPAIVRPKRHFAGHEFHVVENLGQLRWAISSCGLGWYASPVLDKALEFRVYVLQGHAVSVSKRKVENPDQIAWNVAQGASMFKMKRANWPIPVVKKAIAAAEALSLKWAAVDVCVTKGDEIVVFEANTAPGLVAKAKSIPLIAKAFAYADTHRELAVSNFDGARVWKSLLHPGLIK